MNLDSAVVFNKAELAEAVHEKAHAGACGAIISAGVSCVIGGIIVSCSPDATSNKTATIKMVPTTLLTSNEDECEHYVLPPRLRFHLFALAGGVLALAYHSDMPFASAQAPLQYFFPFRIQVASGMSAFRRRIHGSSFSKRALLPKQTVVKNRLSC